MHERMLIMMAVGLAAMSVGGADILRDNTPPPTPKVPRKTRGSVGTFTPSYGATAKTKSSSLERMLRKPRRIKL